MSISINNPFALERIHGPETIEPVKVCTHSGVFHADEVVAIAALALAWGDVEVVRTRDTEKLKIAINDVSVITVDVGGEFDPDMANFDHHQREGQPPPRQNKVPYASAGLIWKHYGYRAVGNVLAEALQARLDSGGSPREDVGFDKTDMLEIQQQVAKTLEVVDAIDTGYSRVSSASKLDGIEFNRAGLSALVGQSNPLGFFGEKSFDGHFEEAVGMVLPVLRRMILSSASIVGLRHQVEGALEAATTAKAPFFVLEMGMPSPTWSGLASQSDADILYAIFPMSSGGFGVQQVPDGSGYNTARKPLPEAWAGLNGEELQKVLPKSVPPGAIFCHPGRFIGGHQTLEGAVALATVAAKA